MRLSFINRTFGHTAGLLAFLGLAGCLSPPTLTRAVIAYDEAITDALSKQLLINIARAQHHEPIHFTGVSNVAATFDFNGHALRRLNERVKDALDPNGILAPGRNGIWPAAHRAQRGKL